MRQQVNKKWRDEYNYANSFVCDERCAPGVAVFLDQSSVPYLIGDISASGGTCDEYGLKSNNVVRELVDLRKLIKENL